MTASVNEAAFCETVMPWPAISSPLGRVRGEASHGGAQPADGPAHPVTLAQPVQLRVVSIALPRPDFQIGTDGNDRAHGLEVVDGFSDRRTKGGGPLERRGPPLLGPRGLGPGHQAQ